MSLLHEFQLLSLISSPYALLNQFLIICISVKSVYVKDPILSIVMVKVIKFRAEVGDHLHARYSWSTSARN